MFVKFRMRIQAYPDLMMYEIVIIMFMSLGYQGDDAIRVYTYNGKPLAFATKEKCLKHVWDNLNDLKAFAMHTFNGAPVKSISCYEKDSHV